MRRKLQYVLIALGIVLLVVIAIPFFVNANAFRPAVEEKLSAVLARQVHVGNLDFSLLTGSLSADDLSIADDPAFSKSPFLTAKSFKIGVEVLTLITSRAVHITGLTIEKPELMLLRNAAGQWNLSSLATGSKAPSEAGPTGPAPDLVIKKVRLKNGRLTVGRTASTNRSIYDNVDLEASDVSMTSQFPMTLTANLPGGGSLKLDGKAGPIKRDDSALPPLDAKLTIQNLDLGSTGFVDSSTGLGGLMDLNSTLASSGSEARVEGEIKLARLKLVKGGAPAEKPVQVGFGSTYNLRSSAGTLNRGKVAVGQAVARLSGTYDLRGEVPVVNLKIDGQDMPVPDLQSVLPALAIVLPKGASLMAGTLNADLGVMGPASKLVTTGTVGLFNAKLAGFDLGSKISALSAFAGVRKGPETMIERLTSNLRLTPEGIRVDRLDLLVPSIGELTGDGSIGANGAIDFKMLGSITSSGAIGSALGRLTGAAQGSKTSVPFRIAGTTSDPKFLPDVKGIIENQLGSALDNPQTKGLAGTLGDFFGRKKKKQ
jgi:AsmA protein